MSSCGVLLALKRPGDGHGLALGGVFGVCFAIRCRPCGRQHGHGLSTDVCGEADGNLNHGAYRNLNAQIVLADDFVERHFNVAHVDVHESVLLSKRRSSGKGDGGGKA